MEKIRLALLALILSAGLAACSNIMGESEMDSSADVEPGAGGMADSDDQEGADEGSDGTTQ